MPRRPPGLPLAPPQPGTWRADWGHNYDVLLPELLTAGVRVMICEAAGQRGG